MDVLFNILFYYKVKKMKIVSLYVPEEWIKLMDDLVKEGHYANRSEFIRMGIIGEFRELKVMFPKRERIKPLLERIGKVLGK